MCMHVCVCVCVCVCMHTCVCVIIIVTPPDSISSPQAHKQSVSESLAASQQDLNNYQAHTEQLNTQITSLNEQLHGATFERDSNLRQNEELGSLVRELESKVGGLEAQRDQLDQDKYNTQTILETLQTEHDTVSIY